jgi:hypothetical protein
MQTMIDVQCAQRETLACAQRRQRREQDARIEAAGKGYAQAAAAQRALKRAQSRGQPACREALGCSRRLERSPAGAPFQSGLSL